MAKHAEESQRIGIDESGKGDYFGPLVIAGVYADEEREGELRALGVRDSKTLSDTRAQTLAEQIYTCCPYSLVVIGPARYNTLHASVHNLNRLLAWGHARAIENLLSRLDCPQVIADQFGDERYLQSALMSKGRTVKLTQRPRAEADPAVAAASVVARAEFLRRLQELSTRHGLLLPKGAGPAVIAAGVALVRRYGEDILSQVAKVHFRTTNAILAAVAKGGG
jgi:ribonuclease HIII